MITYRTVFLCVICFVLVEVSQSRRGIPEGAATLAFVFDTTGSMYDDLVQVRAGAAKILSESLKQRVKPLYNYAIVPFHDPDVGPATITTDAKVFQRHLDDLYVQGGGDCPEMSLTAIILALEISLPGSFIYVFTDAQSKDRYLTEKVLRLVQLKQSQVHFVLTGDCHNKTTDPGFSTYKLISAASTGQVFNLKKKDVNQVLRFAEEFVRANKVNILSVDIKGGGTKSFQVPIDTALDRVTFSLSGKGAKIDIRDQDGKILSKATGLQKLLSLKSAVSVAVRTPRPGLLNVTVISEEGCALRISGLSTVHFNYGFSIGDVDDTENIIRRPAAGLNNRALIKVSGLLPPGAVTKVQLLDLQGLVFQEIAFIPRPDDQYTFDWVNFNAPSGLFYIRIVGVDLNGNVFHRCSPTAISAILPETPVVKADAVREVLVGGSVTLNCKIESVVPCQGHWLKGPLSISPVTTRTGVFNITHTIQSAKKIDGGIYTCYASNAGGVSNATTTLHVKVPRPVVIEKDEVQLTVKSGDTIVLRCAANTKFPITFTWYKNGQPIKASAHTRQQSNGWLFLDIRGRLDSGRYRCIAKSEVGQIARTTILTVNERPFVIIDTTTKNFQQGEEIHSACLVRGFPEPTVMWKKEGKRLTSNSLVQITDDHVLIIKNAQPSDAGRYDCIASNVVGQSKAMVTLKYTVPPIVYVDQDDVTVREGDSVTLECRANAQPTPTIQWYKGRYAVVPSRRIATSSRGHLVINAAQRSDSGFYTCVALNVAGSDSVRISFTVQVPPRVTLDKDQVFIVPGGSTVVQCLALGIPPPVTNWYKDNKKLSQGARVSANNAGELVIDNAVSNDAGNYSCVAMNAGGSTIKTVEISVAVAARIISPPVDNAARLGENVTFHCKTSGVPSPRISWRNSLGFPVANDMRYDTSSRGTLHIRDVQMRDAGRYYCRAENDYGRDEQSAVLMLIGLTPPIIPKDINDSVTAIVGQDFEIACAALGIPKPVITWSYEGFPVDTQGLKYQVNLLGVLLIRKIIEVDSGLYTCTAVNTAGSDSHNFALFVQVPPTITKSPIDIIVNTNDVITLECQATGLPLPKITWQLNNVTLPFNQSRLTIRRATVYNGGVYRCIARSPAGEDTAFAVVNVRGAPKIVHEDTDTFSAGPGKTVILPCQTVGYPKPMITWLKNDIVLVIDNIKYSVDPAGNLRVKGLDPQDMGTYTCHAINQEGFDTVNVTLLVRASPTIVKAPKNVSVLEGKNVTLECVTQGFPPPSIKWIHNGRVLPYNKSVLWIPNTVKSKHEGNYTCVASNLAGSIRFGSIVRILSLEPPTEPPTDDTSAQGSLPVFTDKPYDTTVDSGSNLLWNCATTGKQSPEITWITKASVLQTGNPAHVTILPNNSLLVSGVQVKDEGLYQCQATVDSYVIAVQARLTVRVHGKWSEWLSWGSCSHLCGTGTRTRYRSCSNPPPSNDGLNCSDSHVDKTVCNTQPCPVHGRWSEWTEWSSCLVTCGTGKRIRTRTCSSPSPSNGGDRCLGSSVQTSACNKRACNVDSGSVVISRITGNINGAKIPKTTLTGNFTRRKSNITEIACKVDQLPMPIANWFKYTAPITAPIYWAASGGQPGAKNGLEQTQGLFNFTTRITYGNGEILLIHHVARGVNDRGEMVIDVNMEGATPKFPPKSIVSFQDFKDMFVVTGRGQISSTGQRYFTVDGATLQYLCNNTITFKPAVQPPSTLSQTVEVMDVDVNERPEGIEYAMKTFIKKSPFPDECPQGLVKDVKGQYCEDMNECLFRDTCHHLCENGFGTFTCRCRPGYVLLDDNKSCKDIDECSLPTTKCPPNSYCVNTVGSYSCRSSCGAGYSRLSDGNCQDVDECLAYRGKPVGEDPCTQTCTNNVGSFTCSCKKGYELSKGKCQDVDECYNEICFHGCVNTIGGFKCFCSDGYKQKPDDITMCEDIDECKENATLCGSMQCTNTKGSYSCLQTCKKGFRRTLAGKCEDINECKDGSHTCQFNQLCMNTYGSYYCLCPRGFKNMKIDGPCEDLDECQQFRGICQFKCVNTRGSYKCVCPPGGFLKPDGRSCSGIDGCSLQNLQCGQRCLYSRSGYRCGCFKGYRLHQDKRGCVDINECLSNKTNTCQFHCVNTLGSYKCSCPAGYRLSVDGRRCNDIDECAVNTRICSQPNTRCMNTHGSFRCVKTDCPTSYNVLRPGYCLQPCSTAGLCVPQALRYYTVKLSLGVPANQDLLHLIPYYPPYLQSGLLICDFKYYFPDKSSPFGIKQIGNQAVIFTFKPLWKAGMHQLNVKADIKYQDGRLACVTDFIVYIDVARYLF